MNLEKKQTIFVEEHESTQNNPAKNKVICALCCFNISRPTLSRHVKQLKRKRHLSRVRFREPSKIEPISDRETSWESYRSWTSPELDGPSYLELLNGNWSDALEEFINQTLISVRQSLYEDLSNYSDKTC